MPSYLQCHALFRDGAPKGSDHQLPNRSWVNAEGFLRGFQPLRAGSHPTGEALPPGVTGAAPAPPFCISLPCADPLPFCRVRYATHRRPGGDGGRSDARSLSAPLCGLPFRLFEFGTPPTLQSFHPPGRGRYVGPAEFSPAGPRLPKAEPVLAAPLLVAVTIRDFATLAPPRRSWKRRLVLWFRPMLRSAPYVPASLAQC